MDKNILKQLKTDYEDLEIKPSANLWDQIESGLDSTPETIQKPRLQWLKYAAVIVLLISVGSLFYFNSEKSLGNDKIIVKNIPAENNLKPTEDVEAFIPSENIAETQTPNKTINRADNKLNPVSEISIKRIYIPEDLAITEKEIKSPEVSQIIVEKLEMPVTKSPIADRKKASYISADDLLIGRELDKTREENSKDQRKFGVFDINKIKGPSSLKIFGFSVISDSLDSE